MVIIYTSNTGFTAQYATLLGEATGYPVYTLDEAQRTLPQETEAIYLGWVLASRISGLGKANHHFSLVAACGVGISPPGRRTLEALAKANGSRTFPLFYVPGGYAPDKLKGIYRSMLNLVLGGIRKKLAAKAERTEEDFKQLELITKGGSMVDSENLTSLLKWLEKNQK